MQSSSEHLTQAERLQCETGDVGLVQALFQVSSSESCGAVGSLTALWQPSRLQLRAQGRPLTHLSTEKHCCLPHPRPCSALGLSSTAGCSSLGGHSPWLRGWASFPRVCKGPPWPLGLSFLLLPSHLAGKRLSWTLAPSQGLSFFAGGLAPETKRNSIGGTRVSPGPCPAESPGLQKVLAPSSWGREGPLVLLSGWQQRLSPWAMDSAASPGALVQTSPLSWNPLPLILLQTPILRLVMVSSEALGPGSREQGSLGLPWRDFHCCGCTGGWVPRGLGLRQTICCSHTGKSFPAAPCFFGF